MTASATAKEAGTRPLPGRVRVAVVGAGFAGLATSVRLLEAGEPDFVVLERADDVGGTWRDNSYPGCACDVPSHMYSLSFAPNPDWSRAFSPQPEIQAYLRRTFARFGVLPHVHLRTELLDARWDDAEQCWHLQTSRGGLVADVLVLGTGGLSEPSVPSLPGLPDFAGTTFHSAAWDHAHDLSGERVAVVGTGASAVQFVPHVQQEAASLVLFQRTAPWVLPRRDRAISRLERALHRRVPATQRLRRAGVYAVRESWILGFTKQTAVMRVAERIALRHLRRSVPDPALRAALTPGYRLGCKRVLLSNDYYRALSQPNAEVVTEPVVAVRPHAVVSQAPDGTRTEHPVDTIVFATGFRVSDPPVAHRVRGRDGRTLAQHWAQEGMAALYGCTVAGFPNLFFLVGPNTGLGHNSIIYMIESQVGYVVDALTRVLDRRRPGGATSVEPRREVQDAYDRTVQAALQGTVWNAGGCSSWYLDRTGRNTTLWPTFTWAFRRQVRRFDPEEHLVRTVTPAPATSRPEQVPA